MDLLFVLSLCVFGLGAALCLFFMIFLLRGRPIPGDRGGRQIVKYGELELQTNSIMLLLIISVVMAGLPLGLQSWLKMKQLPLSSDDKAIIFLSGELRDSSDANAKLTDTPLTAINMITKAQTTTRSDQEGHFDFEPIQITPSANRIRLIIQREGYSPREMVVVANEHRIPVTLSKKP